MGSSRPARTSFTGVAFRYADYDTPLWARPNSFPGRWHRARTEPTQYLGLTSDGCWADLIRRENLRSELDVALIRTRLWALKVDAKPVADYSTFELAEKAGFPPDALVDDDWERCQAEADHLRKLGFQGVLSPAVALPGAIALTLFGGRRAVDWDDAPSLASAIPAKVLTRGAPPTGLVERVCFQGDRHATYAEYAIARGRREKRTK